MTENTLIQIARQALELYRAGDLATARSLCENLLVSNRKDTNALKILAGITQDEGHLNDAADLYKRAIQLSPKDVELLCGLGRVYLSQGKPIDASRTFDKALKINSKCAEAVAGKANSLIQRGKHEKATVLLDRNKVSSPETARILAELKLQDGEAEKAHQLALSYALEAQTHPYAKSRLWFLIGRSREKMNHVDEAFEAYQQGNDLIKIQFNPSRYENITETLISVYSRDNYRDCSRSTITSDKPLFIVGMPRSGSTLVEQILHSHPQIHGAGETIEMVKTIKELPELFKNVKPYPHAMLELETHQLDKLARSHLKRLENYNSKALRIVDKNLLNFQRVGAIKQLFPAATIIHCKRNPVEVCLSCYITEITPALHPWTNDLQSIGSFYLNYERLMNHWKNELQIDMIEVNYEDIVTDPEKEIRSLISNLGLDWNDNCLRFYENKRNVTTASANQVNRPIYEDSLQRAVRFAKHIHTLEKVLTESALTTA